MQELDDIGLLRDYIENASEEAFAKLVGRHINKVYSVALRHTGNSHHAEEITQAVFVILAKKAAQLRRGVIISGWLYETARWTAITFQRSEIRRTRREQEAYMQRLVDEEASDLWRQIAPLLDTGMARLNKKDRHAIVLRFFDGKSMSEVGMALGANEDAAKKRVGRALEKLRKFFTKSGVHSTTVILAGVISANSAQTAPVLLAKSVTAVAIAKGAAASASTLTLIKGALKIMAWTKAKTAVIAGIVIIIGAGTVIIKDKFFPTEPSYQGRRLSEWLIDVDYGQPQEKRKLAGEAIRKMGTKTLPFLFADLGDARFKNVHYSTAEKRTPDQRSRQATWAFDALGPQARGAIPELETLLGNNPGYVPSALAGIGREAIPSLLKALTNEDFFIRDNAAAAIANAIFAEKIAPDDARAAFPIAISNLEYSDANAMFQANTRSRAAWLVAALKQSPEISVPLLIRGLKDSNATVASDCAFALSQFGKEAKVAIPELSEAANSTNNQLRIMAKQSLDGIQNAR